MRCPKCACPDDKVIDSRSSREATTIRRRRECLTCGYRFTTYEEIEHDALMVVKRDGTREQFSKDKLLGSFRKACQKRPIEAKKLSDAFERVQSQITDRYEREVPSLQIGEFVMDALRGLDEVAYVRFASVYRRFAEATEFVEMVQKLER